MQHQYPGSILDVNLLERILAEYEVDLVFHLAALLSTRSEFTPAPAHQVNVEGTLSMLDFAQKEGESHGRPVMFIYPSSIAAYGLPEPRGQDAGGQGQGGRLQPCRPRCTAQQALLRAPRPLLRCHYKQLAAETPPAAWTSAACASRG